MIPGDLRPGDALLYKSNSFYGHIIALKTWHPISHVEISLGLNLSSASRDGKGVNLYQVRTDDLVYVWRPKQKFDALAAMNYTIRYKGTPYGWLDLFAFVGLKWDGKGIVCSPWATDVQRAGGVDPFNGEPSRLIAPFQWLTSPAGTVYEVRNGYLFRAPREVSLGAS